jgi:hypothetical protein
MRERQFRCGVNWQLALQENDVKQTGAKEGLGNKTVKSALGDVEQLRLSLLSVCLNGVK